MVKVSVMTTKNIKILAIETSCDETAAAVIGENPSDDGGQPVILSNVISSSVDLHAKTGGIVPEVASRAQMETIVPVISEALISSRFKVQGSRSLNYQEAIKLLDDITHIAVTAGPGLIGSLLVGFSAAKTLAYARDLPIIPINHIEGHVYSAFGGEFPISNFQFPMLALTVSGGHTMLVLMKDHGRYEVVGQTIDDAVGEAYDKVARLLGLGYPGGPQISKLAERFRNQFSIFNFQFSNNSQNSKFKIQNSAKIVFPRPIMKDGTFNFSFSGLKTAVLIRVKKIMAENNFEKAEDIDSGTKEEICAAFEEAVADVLAHKTAKAIEKYQPKSVIFAGGVSANQYLVEKLRTKVEELKPDIQFFTPTREMSGDNAAMIGLAAYYHIRRGDIADWRSIHVDANLKLV